MKFKTKINTTELYSFLLYHGYAGFSGKLGIIVSVAAALLFIKGLPHLAGNETRMFLLGVIALLFTVINPMMLYSKAKKQSLTNPVYKNLLEYELTEDGVQLIVGEQQGGIPWDRIIHIAENKQLYIIYTTRINAFLWPKKDLGDQQKEIMQYVLNHIDQTQVKLPKGLRG